MLYQTQTKEISINAISSDITTDIYEIKSNTLNLTKKEHFKIAGIAKNTKNLIYESLEIKLLIESTIR